MQQLLPVNGLMRQGMETQVAPAERWGKGRSVCSAVGGTAGAPTPVGDLMRQGITGFRPRRWGRACHPHRCQWVNLHSTMC